VTLAVTCAILRNMTQASSEGAKSLNGTVDRQELASRVRAAMAYAGLSRHEVADRCELLSEAKVRRTLDAMRDTSPLELAQLANACDVPLSWFQRGEWSVDDHASRDAPPLVFGQGSLDDRMRVVEHYLALLLNEAARQSASRPLPVHDADGSGDRGRRAGRQVRR
jgi:hypothetical protein